MLVASCPDCSVCEIVQDCAVVCESNGSRERERVMGIADLHQLLYLWVRR